MADAAPEKPDSSPGKKSTACSYKVVIAGGGPAGLTAGLFASRYGLETLILDRGKSSLRQCAYLENYLGFPGGVTVADFLDQARTQAEDAGCHVIGERVCRLEHVMDGSKGRFVVHTRDGGTYLAERFVAATTYDSEYLRSLNVPSLFDENGVFKGQTIDAYGRTSMNGLYLAGPLAGVESEVQIAAGHAAQMALGLIQDVRREQGLWEAIAHYLDWQVRRGVYQGKHWVERVHRYFLETLPEREAPDMKTVHAAVEHWIQEKRARQLDRHEIARRDRRGRRLRMQFADSIQSPDGN